MKKILDLKQFCTYLSISESEARKMVRENVVPFFRAGNRLRFDLERINQWIDEQQDSLKKLSEIELAML